MILKSDVVYIAGPMTGHMLFNYQAFFGMEGLLKKEFGCEVLNPARQPNGLPYERYMELAIADIDKADCIVMLDMWHTSSGAQRERTHAECIGKKVIYQPEIEDYLHEKFSIEFGAMYETGIDSKKKVAR
ncbi:hypothetical protein SDC9_186751 [bioreactor metagenome]|uniref:DUF4406 domain-containing protein n=1 Tax=bioreactor metagenome TaxID=1076179 RepID=A0A645HV26_9ZZZZ